MSLIKKTLSAAPPKIEVRRILPKSMHEDALNTEKLLMDEMGLFLNSPASLWEKPAKPIERQFLDFIVWVHEFPRLISSAYQLPESDSLEFNDLLVMKHNKYAGTLGILIQNEQNEKRYKWEEALLSVALLPNDEKTITISRHEVQKVLPNSYLGQSVHIKSYIPSYLQLYSKNKKKMDHKEINKMEKTFRDLHKDEGDRIYFLYADPKPLDDLSPGFRWVYDCEERSFRQFERKNLMLEPLKQYSQKKHGVKPSLDIDGIIEHAISPYQYWIRQVLDAETIANKKMGKTFIQDIRNILYDLSGHL
jgi:hypothetical protein